MASIFFKSYDQLQNELLTDYSNLDSAPDISQGSMVWISGSVQANMAWGLYKYQDYISNQVFYDTADTESLNHWGSIFGIPRLVADTDATYLNKILDFLRTPPSGGTKIDFGRWTLDSDNVYVTNLSAPPATFYNAFATVVDLYAGLGTVGVYTIPNDETIIDGATPAAYPNNYEELLRVATETYLTSDAIKPLGIAIGVFSAKPQTQDVIVNVSGDVNTSTIQAAIQSELNGMAPGQTLYRSTITFICRENGATSADVTNIASEENTIANNLFFRPGTITVNLI